MAERTLGDVPGLDDLPSNSAVLPASYTYTEVNPLGEITADGSLGSPLDSGDPFAYNIGFLDEPENAGTEGKGYVGQYDPMSSSHMPSYDSSDSSGVSASSGVGTWDEEQVNNARTIAEVGKRLGATDRDVQTAIMAAIVESGLRNLDHGDADSIGMFQQRDAWGSREDRLDPAKSAEMFFLGGQGGQQGLLDIKDREGRSLGDLAQDVQVSAYPERYAEHEQEASVLLGLLGPGTTRGGGKGDPYGLTDWDGETVDNMTAAALEAASKVFGSNFHIMQGSHSHDVAASGNTHAGGGVVDISVENGDWVGAMTALRKIGFAAWVRNVPGFGQAGSGAHIHAVLIGNEQLSPEALQQVQSYLSNDDGLAGSRPDDGPRQFINNRFVWGEKKPKNTGPTWRDQVTQAARTYVGTPFKWGGEDYSGIDSESLLRSVYSKVGVDLPLTAEDLAGLAEPIDVGTARPGDLIGWQDGSGDRYGIYLGNGRLIEAGGPGRVVQINQLGSDALNTFGIPIQSLINKPPQGLNRPAPFSAPSPAPNVYSNPTTGHSMVEPAAHVTSAPRPPHHSTPPGTGALNPDKPHAPIP